MKKHQRNFKKYYSLENIYVDKKSASDTTAVFLSTVRLTNVITKFRGLLIDIRCQFNSVQEGSNDDACNVSYKLNQNNIYIDLNKKESQKLEVIISRIQSDLVSLILKQAILKDSENKK